MISTCMHLSFGMNYAYISAAHVTAVLLHLMTMTSCIALQHHSSKLLDHGS